jgi:hypothetical protein
MDHGLAAEGMGKAAMVLLTFLLVSAAFHVLAAALASIGFVFRSPETRPLPRIALAMVIGYHACLLWLGFWPLLFFLFSEMVLGWTTILCELYIILGIIFIDLKGRRDSLATPDRWVAPSNEEVERVLQGRRG